MGQSRRSRFSVERWTIRVAPALGMAAIALSALLLTESEPRWARVFAGPTDRAGKVAWRVQVKRGTLERQLPAPARVNFTATFAGRSSTERELVLDDDGLEWVMFERPTIGLREPVQVTVREGSRVLAQGSVFVSLQQWRSGERVEGGWCSGHREGEREIRVGVVDGVVLHSMPAAILIVLVENGRALAHERVSVSVEGAEILGAGNAAATTRVDLVTDDQGMAHFALRTIDLAATVRVSSGSPRESYFVGGLPIRAGGLYVARDEATLAITSPIGLDHATIGLLTERGLVDVRTVALTRNGTASSASVAYDSWTARPLWAMVSSETELDAGNTIGWPLLDAGDQTQAHPSVVAPNRLVLDGYHGVTARLERQRRRAWTISSAALLLVGALLVWAVLHSNRETQRQMGALDRLISGGDRGSVAERTPYALIAVVVLTAAIVALTWWVSLAQ